MPNLRNAHAFDIVLVLPDINILSGKQLTHTYMCIKLTCGNQSIRVNMYLKLLFAFKGKIERVCGVWLINLLARQYTWGPSRVVAEQLSLTMSCSPHLCAQHTHLCAQHLHRCPQRHHHLSMFAKLVHHKSGFLCQYSMVAPNETWHFHPQPPQNNLLLFSFLPDHRRKEAHPF